MRYALVLPSGVTVMADLDDPLSPGDPVEVYGGRYAVERVVPAEDPAQPGAVRVLLVEGER